jgi:ElaB/YqjD/DUF883 family membrane-anchored ribosome-binding protein
MTPNMPVESTNNAADPGRSGDDAVRSIQRGTAQDLRQQVAPLLARAGEQASALAQRGVDAVRDRSLQVREQALRASDSTLNYIKDEPVKAVLIAAATGAVLMALIGLWRKSS